MDEKKILEPQKACGGRLARRAKSFKEDFLGKINQMRSQSGTRSGSPNKISKSKVPKTLETVVLQDESNPNRSEIDSILHSAKLLSSALRYFQDVVQKNTWEMLPGSVNVVLESVIMIHSTLKKALVDEQSSVMMSATNQVYQSLASLIRWADCVVLQGDQAIQKEDICNISQALQNAIKTLVQLSIDKLQNKETKNSHTNNHNGLHTSKLESPHRNSLPDIPLTPREREILEATPFPGPTYFCPVQMHHSASSDSVLGKSSSVESTVPPPKPPLPTYSTMNHVKSSASDCPTYKNLLDCAPPLPPKKKVGTVSQSHNSHMACSSDSILFDSSCCTLGSEFSFQHIIDGTSPFSQSPENSTPLSKSSASSFDSNLDCSADELSFGFSKHSSQEQSLYDCNVEQTFLCAFSPEMSSCTIKESKTLFTVQEHDSIVEMNSIVDSMKKVVTTSESIMSLISMSVTEPPALPAKLRSSRTRTPSQYDNVSQLLIPDLNDLSSVHENDCNAVFRDAHDYWLIEKHAPTCPRHTPTESNVEVTKPPPLPPKKKTVMAYMQMFGSYSQPSEAEFLHHSLHSYSIIQASWQQMELSFMPVFPDGTIQTHTGMSEEFLHSVVMPPALPPKKSRVSSQNALNLQSSLSLEASLENICNAIQSPTVENCNDDKVQQVLANIHNDDDDDVSETADFGILEEQDVSHYIVFKKPGEEGPDVRAGSVDSLIVHATKADKNDFLYQEAFLTTYRTFISPFDLIKKLLYRYTKFIHMSDMRQRAARNAFSLLVRVVSDLCMADVKVEILTVLMDFIYQLVTRGDLMLARALRTKVVEKCEARRKCLLASRVLLPSMAVSTHQSSLLDFKSEGLAEQMTLLDADLFQKIEIPEVLLWAKEQKEELSLNLTKFTEHFNKMSYWARSRILDQEEAKDREKYVVKFIKIMKYLRKLNNFNSYLAILSALDSAPIRRLEWQRNITEGLKEYCALIDSSSSFRAYRQALAETTPPCIPYIGLILQDLTFVHIGNSDWLLEGSVNFSKRWQQFNILDNMRRFKNSQYPFRRNDNIIAFFNNFDDYLCEEAMWQISETIKPRGVKKKSMEQL